MSLELLRRVPSLATLPADELARLLDGAQTRDCPMGALLLREGETDECLCVVASGQFEIVKALGSPDERVLAVCAAGDLLGEMSLFSPDGAHTASARAIEPASALALNRVAFDGLLQRQPALAYAMMRRLSQRLDEGEHITVRELRAKNRVLAQAYRELEAAQAQLVEKERLEREVELARQIQRAMLPQTLPAVPGYDLGAMMVPAKLVGGDFYDALWLDATHLALAVGDVCDKGFGAAFFMAQCFGLLRAEALRRRAPGATLRAFNRLLLGVNRSEMYVTLLYAVLEAPTGRLRYCRAGHPPLLLVLPDGRQQRAPTQPGQMLGLFDDPLLDEGEVLLPPGSVALLYSDGLTEATDAQGLEGGSERVGSIVAAAPGAAAAQALCATLWEALRAPAGAQGVHDDFTVIACRRLAP